jgi:hypothetical protein
MRLDELPRSDRVEDRRGSIPVGRAGGLVRSSSSLIGWHLGLTRLIGVLRIPLDCNKNLSLLDRPNDLMRKICLRCARMYRSTVERDPHSSRQDLPGADR